MAKKSQGKVIQMLSPENYIRKKTRSLPIFECMVNAEWEEGKLADIVVARQHTNGNITAGLYHVDLACLGVKDTAYFFNIPLSEYRKKFEVFMNMEDSFEKIDYVLAHNIIHAGLEFADEYEFKPHKDFTSITQYILDEDTDDIPLIEIECGVDGLPAFMQDTMIADREDQKIIAHLDRVAGPGNYYLLDEEGMIINDEEDSEPEKWEKELNDRLDFYLDNSEYSEFDSKLKFDKNTVQNSKSFQLKVSIDELDNPKVWRRIIIPSYFSFNHLHYVIQAVFGWTDSHLYQFSGNGFGSNSVICKLYDEYESHEQEQLDAMIIPLSRIFKREGDTYTYIYDFGDSWQHTILLEKVIPKVSYLPDLLDGKGACPPEDCGGIMGYQNMLEILTDQNHPEYYEYLEWLGLEEDENWDPEEFDIEYSQEVLMKMFATLISRIRKLDPE